jgi:hypothetical protein
MLPARAGGLGTGSAGGEFDRAAPRRGCAIEPLVGSRHWNEYEGDGKERNDAG